MTTEHERLTALGRKYLFAAGKLIGFPGTETELFHEIGNGSGYVKLIVDVAKVIATADRPEPGPSSTRRFISHKLQWETMQFNYHWDDSEGFDYLLDEDDVLTKPLPGDLLYLEEHHENRRTGRKMIFLITSVQKQPDGRLRVTADFITRKEAPYD